MAQGTGEVLPFAIGVAISPVPVIAVILMLLSGRAKVNGPMFLADWVVALASRYGPRLTPPPGAATPAGLAEIPARPLIRRSPPGRRLGEEGNR
jgi:hypothetical protein